MSLAAAEGAKEAGTGGWARALSHPTAQVACILGVMGAMLIGGAFADSPTTDEPNHLTRGVAILQTGDAKLSIAHPPLANAIQALPAGLFLDGFDVESTRGWERWSRRSVVHSMVSGAYPEARAAIIAGRLMTALLTILFGLYLYRLILPISEPWARWTVLLFAFHPIFLSHGRLLTTDLAIGFAVVLAVGEAWRYLRSGGWLPLIGAGLALGAALSVKFSGLFLLPPLAAVLGICAVRCSPRFPTSLSLGRRLLRATRDAVLIGAVACLVVNATYGFQRTGMTVQAILDQPQPDNYLAKRYDEGLFEVLSPLSHLPRWLPIPLPYPYLFGTAVIQAQNDQGHGGWFWGERTRDGSRAYVPTMLAIKAPAAASLLFLLAAALWLRRPRLPKGAGWLFLLVPATYLGVALPSKVQLGVRHLLPVIPFLVLASAWGGAKLEGLGGKAKGAALGLVALLVVESVATYPRHLSHFNWLIGGPAVGHRISMIGEDWGQDIAELARVAKEEGLSPLYYQTYGWAPPSELRYHGVPFRRFRCSTKVEGPAWIARHASSVVRGGGPCGPIPKGATPDRVLNHHIYLYRVP